MGCWPPTHPCAPPSPPWRQGTFRRRCRRIPLRRRWRHVTAPPPAICGPCCWRALMKFSYCAVSSVTPRCASSPSSTNRVPCARFSITSPTDPATAHRPRARTTALGRPRRLRHRGQRCALGAGQPTATGDRIRSAPCLVMRNFFLGLGRLVSSAHRLAGSWSALHHFLPLGEWARCNTAFASNSNMKNLQLAGVPHPRTLGVARLNY